MFMYSELLEKKEVCLSRECEISLPNMANKGLSENWLFKEFGDIHWNLITKSLSQKSSAVSDTAGNRLYATFVRIRFEHTHALCYYRENEMLRTVGSVKKHGPTTYLSKLVSESNGKKIYGTLMTMFSKKGNDGNSKLISCAPANDHNEISYNLSNQNFLNDYRLLKKDNLETLIAGNIQFQISNSSLFQTSYCINPYYDVNGVGLLYFAAYPIISDKCEADFFNTTQDELRWENQYHTIFRDVFYFGNCNTNDQIIYELNSFESLGSNKIKIASSLYRQSDMQLMAKIFTVKSKQD
jgi:probable biosynthetic protein (TIGR04098 family)